MPPSPRAGKKNRISSALIRSFALSALLHVLVIGLFAFGVARGYHEARRHADHNWLDLGAEVRAAKAVRKIKPVTAQQPVPNTIAAIPSPKTETSENTSTEDDSGTAAASTSSQESRDSAEARYVTELAKLLNRSKQYPRESVLREQEGKIVVSVSLDHDGVVHEKVIESPSPFRLLNEAALETVSRIGRFPAPPLALLNSPGNHGTGSLRLKIPISFQLDR